MSYLIKHKCYQINSDRTKKDSDRIELSKISVKQRNILIQLRNVRKTIGDRVKREPRKRIVSPPRIGQVQRNDRLRERKPINR